MKKLKIPNSLIYSFLLLLATAISFVVTEKWQLNFDDLAHDWVVTQDLRETWQHTMLLHMDDDVPSHVSRKQSVGLYAQAAENLLNAGAKGVLFDGTLYEFNKRADIAACLNEDSVNWRSLNQFNPLQALTSKNLNQFLIPKPANNVPLLAYLSPAIPPPVWLNYQFIDVRVSFPDTSSTSALNRLQTLNKDHGAFRLASQIKTFEEGVWNNATIPCTTGKCIRVRQSLPVKKDSAEQPLLALSKWSQCELSTPPKNVEGKLVVLQLASLHESTDIQLTPLSHHFAGGHMVSGAQYLVDATETLIHQDMPRFATELWIVSVIIIYLLIIGFSSSLFTSLAALIVTLLLIASSLLLPMITPYQIWPITFLILSIITGTSFCILFNLSRNKKSVKLVRQYLPKQLQNDVTRSGNIDPYINKKVDAVVLLSDLQSYTKISDELNDPALLFELLNTYFSEVTQTIQNDFEGWLEGYAGDQFIFYWPIFNEEEKAKQVERGVQSAFTLLKKQQAFFETLSDSASLSLPQEKKDAIQKVIGAGVGLSFGEVAMGNLGNNTGVMQFGIIGCAINNAARLEGLSRTFTSKVYMSSSLYEQIENPQGLLRFIKVRLKGWHHPDWIYIPYEGADLAQKQDEWDQIRTKLESSGELPEGNDNDDLAALFEWYQHGLWNSEESYWDIQFK